MPRVRPMLAISIGFTTASAAMFAMAASTAFRSALFISLDRDGAVAAIILAGMCWLEVRRDRERERRDGARIHDECRRREEVLILALNSQVDAPTGPLQRLRAL